MTTYHGRPYPCSGKMRYLTEEIALEVAARQVGKHNTSHLRAYPCKDCHGWHLTSKPA